MKDSYRHGMKDSDTAQYESFGQEVDSQTEVDSMEVHSSVKEGKTGTYMLESHPYYIPLYKTDDYWGILNAEAEALGNRLADILSSTEPLPNLRYEDAIQYTQCFLDEGCRERDGMIDDHGCYWAYGPSFYSVTKVLDKLESKPQWVDILNEDSHPAECFWRFWVELEQAVHLKREPNWGYRYDTPDTPSSDLDQVIVSVEVPAPQPSPLPPTPSHDLLSEPLVASAVAYAWDEPGEPFNKQAWEDTLEQPAAAPSND